MHHTTTMPHFPRRMFAVGGNRRPTIADAPPQALAALDAEAERRRAARMAGIERAQLDGDTRPCEVADCPTPGLCPTGWCQLREAVEGRR